LADVIRVLGSQARTDLASSVLRFLKVPQLAGEATEVGHFSTHGSLTAHLALLPPTSQRGHNIQYPAIHWLNDDILLNIFNFYRLDTQEDWNVRLLWCKLSHVCQRWRHLIYECAFHLSMHIKCSEGSLIVDTLDHLPPLPLFIDYKIGDEYIMEEDESGIYHALRLHDRVRHIHLKLPQVSIFREVLVLMDENFPILEHLSLSFSTESSIPLTLPKAFLAPNLRHLSLPGISPPKRLRFLTSTLSLVTLELNNIQTSSYFRPRVLVARLLSLPQLEDLSIGFSIPIPRPSTERELLGEQGAPVTLPSLKYLWFRGVSAYLESLIAQIRVPLLERLEITLFNQIAFELPHLSHLINITEGLKFPVAWIYFSRNEVSVTARNANSSRSREFFLLRVKCKQLDWQIDCAAQICNALIPLLSDITRLTLEIYEEIPTEWQNGAINGTAWYELIRSFTGVKALYIHKYLSEELSRALQLDAVGTDAGFLPDLQNIVARDNLFATFIDTRRVVGRPVKYSSYSGR
jgi:hypothetical protein